MDLFELSDEVQLGKNRQGLQPSATRPKEIMNGQRFVHENSCPYADQVKVEVGEGVRLFVETEAVWLLAFHQIHGVGNAKGDNHLDDEDVESFPYVENIEVSDANDDDEELLREVRQSCDGVILYLLRFCCEGCCG